MWHKNLKAFWNNERYLPKAKQILNCYVISILYDRKKEGNFIKDEKAREMESFKRVLPIPLLEYIEKRWRKIRQKKEFDLESEKVLGEFDTAKAYWK